MGEPDSDQVDESEQSDVRAVELHRDQEETDSESVLSWDELDTDPPSERTGTDWTAESDQETDVEESAPGPSRADDASTDVQQFDQAVSKVPSGVTIPADTDDENNIEIDAETLGSQLLICHRACPVDRQSG